MSTKRVHLLCNAHLDPVWQWPWQEGAAETLSTFRTAADLCEEFGELIFNHNEALLYQWVERFEPALFKRIQKLVKQGRWHIMGGWFLQPDCNMSSGESLVRQILFGRTYFAEKFGVEPTVAINFDPFGHSDGLVQILAKTGYRGYLFGRPNEYRMDLPNHDFVWVGNEGSQVLASRFIGWYNSPLGNVEAKVQRWLERHPHPEFGICLWGVGDHGGGPSRADLKTLRRLARDTKNAEVIHSTTEQYFEEVEAVRDELPRWQRDLNPSCIGCYTSQIRIKQKHRQLENELYATEKMLAPAVGQGLMDWPTDRLMEINRDLLMAEFHDILPGSSVQVVEDDSLRLMDHALEEVSRIKTEAMFALAVGQARGKPGWVTLLVYNPHPHAVETVVDTEFHLPDLCHEEQYTVPYVYQGGKLLDCQPEKEASSVPLDWRRRVVFRAKLGASSMSRFDVQLVPKKRKPAVKLKERNGRIRVKTDDLEIVINARTGLVDRYRVKGVDQVAPGAFQPVVHDDNEDSWRMSGTTIGRAVGRFKLMSRKEGTRFAGLTDVTLPSVRVIEDGPARSVIEAVFSYGGSAICQHYLIPKKGTEFQVDIRVHWNEKDRCLKLHVPTPDKDCDYLGDTVFSRSHLPTHGDEAVAQKWTAVVGRSCGQTLTCINDGTYGSDCKDGELALTLVRSPAYAGHPIPGRDILEQDRHTPRLDQGERRYRFWFNGGPTTARLRGIDREAMVRNEAPYVVPCNPPGVGKKPRAGVTLSDGVVRLVAVKRAHRGNDLIVRLFEPTGRKRSTVVAIPFLGIRHKIELTPFEVKTLRVNPRTRKVREADLLERPTR